MRIPLDPQNFHLLAEKGGVLLTLRGQILPQVLAKRTSIMGYHPHLTLCYRTEISITIMKEVRQTLDSG